MHGSVAALSMLMVIACTPGPALGQFGARRSAGEGGVLGQDLTLLDSLRNLRQQFSSGSDGDGLLASLIRPFRQDAFNASAPPGPPVGACDAVKAKAFAQIQVALQLALTVTAQAGEVESEFLGNAGETDVCAGQNCAYTNPSSPYGLTIIPLPPTESAAAKLQSGTMPTFASQDLRMRNGFPSQPTLIDRISGAAAAASSNRTTAEQSSSPNQPGSPKGMSSVWQLLPDEVVLVAGCLPPATASRYTAITPYMHSLYDEQLEDWVSVFASMGDSLGAFLHPDSGRDLPPSGIRNRINSTLPGLSTKPSASTAQDQPLFPQTRLWRDQTPIGSQLAELGLGGLFFSGSSLRSPPPSSAAPASPQQLEPASISQAHRHRLWAGLLNQSVADSVTASAAGLLGTRGSLDRVKPADSPFDQFTIILMGASPEAIQRVQGVLDPVLWRLGLSDAVNVLPITPPFSDGIGLQPTAPYYMLLTRNILGANQRAAFKQYSASNPWRVWRVTPSAFSWGVLPRLTQPFNADTTGFPPAQVISRVSTGVTQNEEWLRPALNWLLLTLNQTLTASGQVLSWSVGADSGLGSAGVDWGVDCVRRRIDFCNGDNRDAQYIVSLPLLSLDHMDKVAYVVGVNHVNTGLASYLNVAPTDPIQRLGLQAWDDQEMAGSADALMSGGPYAGLSSLFYVLAYARNCTGIPFCKEIPITGPRSLPLARRMLLLARAYVNPATGVGPSASSLLKLRTVVACPEATALQIDYRPLTLTFAPQGSSTSCRPALTSTSVSCPQVMLSAAEGGGGGSDRETRRVLPTLQRVSRSLPTSDCCTAASTWAAERCWCTAEGQSLLDALSPLPARTLLASVGRLCRQPVRFSLAECS